jgi:hypothetical protein
MNFSVAIQVTADTATPAVERLTRDCEPYHLAEKLRDPLLNLVRNHYEALPPNKKGWPATGFWHRASDSTYAVDDDHGVTITTYKIGVRQRRLGGPIDAARVKNLAIPGDPESYGKVPADFDNLVF